MTMQHQPASMREPGQVLCALLCSDISVRDKRIMPTGSLFQDWCHCCLVCAHWVSCREGCIGYIRKALEKGYSQHLRSACCTDMMVGKLVRGQCMFRLPPCVDSNHLPLPQTNCHSLLLPPLMHHRSVWFEKGHVLSVQNGLR